MAPGPISENAGYVSFGHLGLSMNRANGTSEMPNTESAKVGHIANGSNSPGHHQPQSEASPELASHPDDQAHDLICVGFGPASLAIAIALHDFQTSSTTPRFTNPSPKVRFLERQPNFHWHAGMLLPSAKMQISFIKDLATIRDPRSHFTFLNYLKTHNRLVQFSNLGTFLPSRLEFEDYLRWSASHFSPLVSYSHEVQHIRPLKTTAGKYDCFQVTSIDTSTSQTTTHRAKNIVIAVGGKPARPTTVPAHHPRILHSSEYSVRIASILPLKEHPYTIAIIGGGQSAAEVFHDLHTRYPHASTRLIIRDTALRPSDDSPFVNEVFHPDAVDPFYSQPEPVRGERIHRDKATNYSVVRLELLEKIYQDLYTQSIAEPDKDKWLRQVLPSREIVDVVDLPPNKRLTLILDKLDTSGEKGRETLAVDAVVLATGYHRDAHVDMLQECQVINASHDGRWQTQRDYGVHLDRSKVSTDMGIWLQGCNEGTHGLSDSLLSILATRSGELVQSIFGRGETMNGR